MALGCPPPGDGPADRPEPPGPDMDAGAKARADSDAKENAASLIVVKRLRAANKKLKRIDELEAAKAQGKEINADQARRCGGWASPGDCWPPQSEPRGLSSSC